MPDGHPMTWNSKEIEKSHGSGVLRLNEIPSHIKWLKIWYRSCESSLIWRGWERAFQVASNLEDLDLNCFYAENQIIWKETLQKWNLAPVKKILILKSTIQEPELVFEKHEIDREEDVEVEVEDEIED